MTPDPIGLDGGINLYAYVGGDPVNWIDSDGLKCGLPRDDASWNNPNRVKGNNCYEYASNKAGTIFDPNNRSSFKNPGGYSGSSITSLSQINCAELMMLAKADGMKDPGPGPCCDSGYHLVYLVCDPGRDYHWYRKDEVSSGRSTWSHKPGETPVTDKDARGNTIYDPEKANKDYSRTSGVNYQNCGYLCAPN